MGKRNSLITSALALVIIFGCWHSHALAQTKAANPPTPAVKALPKPLRDKVTWPEINMLIRTTMVALYQANITGNYTVLRDIGAMSFQTANTPVRLGNLYSRIRESDVDLAPAVLIDPLLYKPPFIDPNGILLVEGFFPTEPLNIVFKMGFRFEFGSWRIFSLSVGAQPPGSRPPEDTKKAVSGNKKKSGKSDGTGTLPLPKNKPGVDQ